MLLKLMIHENMEKGHCFVMDDVHIFHRFFLLDFIVMKYTRAGQTTARGPHAARETISCGPRALTEI